MNFLYLESKSKIKKKFGGEGWGRLVGGAGVSIFFTMNSNLKYFFLRGGGEGGGGKGG